MNGDPNILLANCVWAFHVAVVLFVLLAPFSNVSSLLVLHVTFSLSLLVHWWGNSNVCSLSVMESQLRGVDYTNSFTHQFIAPVYDMSKTTWSTVCYVTTIMLACISLYNISNSDKWQSVKDCLSNVQGSEIPFYHKLFKYIACFTILLTP